MRRRPRIAAAVAWLHGEPWRIVVAGLGLAATVVGLATGVFDLRDRLFPDPKPRDPNVEVVVDRSEAMAQELAPGRSKFASAVETAVAVAETYRGTNLALRGFGGPCRAPSDLLLGFGTHDGGDVALAFRGEHPRGEADVVRAVIDATADFDDLERFPDDVGKRIVVVTGGHSCPGDPAEQVQSRLEALGAKRRLDVDFRFIGFDVEAADRARLRDVARAAGAPSPAFVEDADELRRALARYAVVEPLVESIATLGDLVDESVGQINAAKDAVYDDADRERAEAALGEARATVRDTETRFRRLATRYADEGLQQLHALAGEVRELQLGLVDLVEDDLELAARDPGSRVEEVDEAVHAWNDAVATYNETRRELTSRSEEILRRETDG
jgi:hypothetical protein